MHATCPHNPLRNPLQSRHRPAASFLSPQAGNRVAKRCQLLNRSHFSTLRQSKRCHRQWSTHKDTMPAKAANQDSSQEPVKEAEGEHPMESLASVSECTFPSYDSATQADADYRISNTVQLSAYGNRIGKNLKDLESFLEDDRVKGAIKGLHLLPIYPSSGDGGFAPITYKEVDPEFGTWEDVQRLAQKYDLLMECMVNHISPESEEFQGFLADGDNSKYADMFIDWEKFWPQGRPTDEDLARIRTRKAEQPMLEVTMKDGSKRKPWCTFGPQQIDINPFLKPGAKFVEESLRSLCERGAKLIRLDAFGYITKKIGTPCFFEEPEVWDFLNGVGKLAAEYDVRLLCEVHEDFATNIKLAMRGFWVYDFALPLLVLHALHWDTALNLRHWLEICPRRQITVLDTHDGMGIDDITGLTELADQEQLAEVVEKALGCGPNYKYYYKNGKYEGSPHQYNCTYFSALGKQPQDYLLARAIQFFTPGIPMVYYNGLFAGTNDLKLLEETGNSRDINRHIYSLEEASQALDKPVVKALLALCRARNEHKAFLGTVSVNHEQPDSVLDVTWSYEEEGVGRHHAQLLADMCTKKFEVLATRLDEGSGELICTKYHLEEEKTVWAQSSPDDTNGVGSSGNNGSGNDGNGTGNKSAGVSKKKHFSDI